MKAFALVASTLLGAAAQLPSVHGWWDNGHMLVGEVASQLMSPEDRATIENVLTHWEDEFPNTNTITTAAIWPDLIRCNKISTSCSAATTPSLTMMEVWHYVNLPMNVNGSKWNDVEIGLDLFNAPFKGSLGVAADFLDKTMTSFATTKSIWAANLALRNLVHIVGDLHQPLHTVGGVSDTNPNGDQGGNLYKFAPPCAHSNLHALWDSVGLDLVNYWGQYASFKCDLAANATTLIATLLPTIDDSLNLEQYSNLSYSDFVKALSSGSAFKNLILGSYQLCVDFVYPKLNLTYDAAGYVACPSDAYVAEAISIAKHRIALGGKRLAVILTHLAAQIRTLGLAP